MGDLIVSLRATNDSDGCRICEDALVYFWKNRDYKTWGVFSGLTSAPFTNVVTRWNGYADSLCPASGRFVRYKQKGHDGRIVVVDFF